MSEPKSNKVLRFPGNETVIETVGEPVQKPTAERSTINKAALSEALDAFGRNLLIAQNRLVELVDATQCAEASTKLMERYSVLQAKRTSLQTRAAAALPNIPDASAALVRDTEALNVDVQKYIDAVEALVSKHPKQVAQPLARAGAAGVGATAPAASVVPKRDLKPFVILGGMAVLIGGGAYFMWRQQAQQEKAVARASKRAFAAIPARGSNKPGNKTPGKKR